MLIAYFSQYANGSVLAAEPNCSAIIILMLMMSAELQRHSCDLIKPNLGQSILAAAEHLNIIITLLQPNLLRSALPPRTTGQACRAANSCSSSVLSQPCPAFGHGLTHSPSFGSEFHHDPNQKWDFVFKISLPSSLCLWDLLLGLFISCHFRRHAVISWLIASAENLWNCKC